MKSKKKYADQREQPSLAPRGVPCLNKRTIRYARGQQPLLYMQDKPMEMGKMAEGTAR
jgi:hypothetical protein